MNDMEADQEPSIFAPQACISCRKQKRKCDKQIPSCSLCVRIGRACEYAVPERAEVAAPTAGEFDALRERVQSLERLLASLPDSSHSHGIRESSARLPPRIQSPSSLDTVASSTTLNSWGEQNEFPSLFFLDGWMFSYGGYQIPQPYIKVPADALTTLGSSHELRAMIEEYFRTIHVHFPIISKIRLYQHLSNPLHEPGADVALLFLAMKLITTELPVGSSAVNQLYHEVKALYRHCESLNALPIQAIQALLLIALYEVGHAIYPAAYLTTGLAARLCHAMGLHNKRTVSMLPKPSTWTEQEERIRINWAVLILDRVVNAGHRYRPLATEEPNLDTRLPTCDDAWDRGQMAATAPLRLSASQTLSATPFARTCQASYLLGKVIKHACDDDLPSDYRYEEAEKLFLAHSALLDAVQDSIATHNSPKRASFFTAMGVCLSSMLTLCDIYSCNSCQVAEQQSTEAQMKVHQKSIDMVSEMSDRALSLGRWIVHFAESNGLGQIGPLLIESLYSASANFAWYVRESSDLSAVERLGELKEILKIIDKRWHLGGEVIRIVETSEYHISAYAR